MSTSPVWIAKGEHVGLAAPEQETFVERWRIYNDPHISAALCYPTSSSWPLGTPPYSREQRAELYEAHAHRRIFALDICLIDSGEAIGEAMLSGWIWPHASVELQLVVFSTEHRGKRLGAEAIYLLCEHAFVRLGFHRVYASYAAFNERSAGFIARELESLGGRSIGTAREAVWANGSYHDEHLVELLASDFTARPATAPVQPPAS